jgi:hypothetical protein
VKEMHCSLFISLLLVLCATGCHTTHALNTASGRPEVIIQGKSAQQILHAAREFFLHRGYSLKPSDNAYKLTFDRRSEKPGGKPSASDCWRVRLALVDAGNGSYRLIGTPTKVEGCGGELESEHAMPVAYPQIQVLLQEIRAQL